MSIRMRVIHAKVVAKQWFKAHTPHMLAAVSTMAIIAVGVMWASESLANFLDKEFIQPTVAINLTK